MHDYGTQERRLLNPANRGRRKLQLPGPAVERRTDMRCKMTEGDQQCQNTGVVDVEIDGEQLFVCSEHDPDND